MSFIQHTVLKKQTTLNAKIISQSYKLYADYFHNPSIQENIRNSKEEQFQEGFLRELFVKVLGYTLNPTPNYNLITEQKNETNAKKADGAILINGEVVGVIELKDCKTTDLKTVETQAFGYKNYNKKAVYVITSNFEKLRFYIDNAIDYEEFNLFTLSEERFALLWLCLAYENIAKDLPKRLKNESVSNEDQITKELYKDYSRFKRELFADLTEQNPQYDKLLLFKKSQKLLDRLLFIFFAEDRNLLPPNSVKRIIDQWDIRNEDVLNEYQPLYGRFKMYFKYMNEGHKGKKENIFGYNGGLFKPDEVLDNIKIDDDVLKRNILKMSAYDFESEVDVNILGHIFENSLTEIEEITQSISKGETTPQTSKRKKDGVFYTPRYITTYIVENTLGKLCANKKAELEINESEYFADKKRQLATKKKLDEKLKTYRQWLLGLSICDPACGSGAFLNAALDFLIAEHSLLDEMSAKLLGGGLVFPDVENAILENNLYGVDINEESVEIAKLALWLRTAKPNRKLNSLNNNIKCGNSLISDPEVAGDKAFDWQKEFPQVFEKGGFNVVIGNPPYVQTYIEDKEKKYYLNNYKTNEGKIDLYRVFIEKGICLINQEHGIISFITPNSFLSIPSAQKLRKFIKEETQIDKILIFDGSVFENVSINSVIFIFEKRNSKDVVEFIRDKNISPNQNTLTEAVSKTMYLNYEEFLLNDRMDTIIDKSTQAILNKINAIEYRLSDVAEYTLGLQVYHNTMHSKEAINERVYHSAYKKDDTYIPEIGGKNLHKYGISLPTKEFVSYGEWCYNKPDSKYLEGKRILMREIPSKTNLVCTLFEGEGIPNKAVIIIKSKDNNIYELLAILNSKLIGYYINHTTEKGKQNLFPRISLTSIKTIPVRFSNTITLSDLSIKMLSLNTELQTKRHRFISRLKNNFENIKITGTLEKFDESDFKGFTAELKKQKISLSLKQQDEWEEYFNEYKSECNKLASQITETDKTIDKMVYELYGLTEEEIKIVENENN